MKRFEYKTVEIKSKGIWATNFNPEEIDKELNKLGSQGWELVSIGSRDTGGTLIGFFYTFKREI